MNLRPSGSISLVDAVRIAGERHSQQLVTAFVISGIFFMVLPGTFLGVWNLLAISETHQVSAIPAAWLQAHGQAQIFGWIGSFILGIGLYSLTKMKSSKAFPVASGWIIWSMWTVGGLLRWLGGVTEKLWHVLLPLSAVLQLCGFVLFYLIVRRHRTTTSNKREIWMLLVALSAISFLVALIVNCGLLFHQAISGVSPTLPHIVDQQFVTLAVWGVLVPTIWGFNARWFPVFAGLQLPRGRNLCIAYGLSIAGIVATFFQSWLIASVIFLLAALLSIDALHVWSPPINPPKLLNVHPTFAIFVRLTYIWLLVSCFLAVFAARWDSSGGIWGASRHALTVGFVTGMVFAIGQRVLPAFCGMRVLWSRKLMFWSLLLLFSGCLLRVVSEPLAYENVWRPAWKILPVSAITELTAVTLFALNIGVTLLLPPAHLRRQTYLRTQPALN